MFRPSQFSTQSYLWFLLVWLAVGVVGSIVYGIILWSEYQTTNSLFIIALLVVPGMVVGVGQWHLVCRRLGLPTWPVISWTIGSILQGWAVLGVFFVGDSLTYVPMHWFLSAGPFGGILGAGAALFQILALERHRWESIVWIGSSVVATALCWPTALYVGTLVNPHDYNADVGFTVLALLTSPAAIWLMHNDERERIDPTSERVKG